MALQLIEKLVMIILVNIIKSHIITIGIIFTPPLTNQLH